MVPHHSAELRTYMPTLVLLRHGQSRWNLENRFTGWVDVDLTEKGEAEARKAGELIAQAGLSFDRAYTSVLTRAIRTNAMALETAGQSGVPVEEDWRLNERHYGGLTGLDKAETAAKHGADQVKIWRRSYDIPPPDLPADSEHQFAADPRYADADVPAAESLKTTLERVLPYWEAVIAPRLRVGEDAITHGAAVHRAVGRQHYVTELADNVRQSFAARGDDFAGGDVGIGHRHAQRLERRRQRTLAAGDTAGDGDHQRQRRIVVHDRQTHHTPSKA